MKISLCINRALTDVCSVLCNMMKKFKCDFAYATFIKIKNILSLPNSYVHIWYRNLYQFEHIFILWNQFLELLNAKYSHNTISICAYAGTTIYCILYIVLVCLQIVISMLSISDKCGKNFITQRERYNFSNQVIIGACVQYSHFVNAVTLKR